MEDLATLVVSKSAIVKTYTVSATIVVGDL